MSEAISIAPTYCLSCGTIVQAAQLDDRRASCPHCSSVISLSAGEDVFISYSSADLDLAQSLARSLQSQDVRFWLAPELIQPTENFVDAIAQAIPESRVMVFLLSEASLGSPWVVKEAALGVSNRKTVLAVRRGDVKLTPGWTFMLTDIQWFTIPPAPDEKDFVQLSKLIRRKLAPSAAMPTVSVSGRQDHVEPRGVDPNAVVYVGPRPYPEGMETRFFGRDTELLHLIDRLRQSAAILLISPSGAGKSSLLAAGLAPALRKAGHQVFTDARVGRAIPKSFENRLDDIQNVFAFSSMHGLGGLLTSDRTDLTVAGAMAALPPAERDRLRVLILDQFEEIFTQHRDRFAERPAFIDQLIEASRADPNLRIVFAMRQEYLADFQMLVEPVPPEYQPVLFQLRRMQKAALTEVVQRPALEFAQYSDDALAAIISQLNTVRFRQPDGSTSEKPGEYIELVHLQIICERLWRSLPTGLRRIERHHLVDAAKGIAGQDFDNFVRNALELFYSDVVSRVSRSAETERHGGYSVDLIKLGCMKFVSRDGTRQPIQEGEQSTGRLPNWIVKQLADFYLLRTEIVGRERWYELSHDLLADAVAREIDIKVRDLLYASDRLEKELKHFLESRGADLSGYFEINPDLLEVCRPYISQPGLHASEAEFVFRISLGSGLDVEGWSSRLLMDYPDVYRAVLIDALNSANPDIRSNAACVLAIDLRDEFTGMLVELATHDPSLGVRRTAAIGVLKRNNVALFSEILDGTDTSEKAPLKIRLAALLLALSDLRSTSLFERSYRALPLRVRARIRTGAWWRRFVDDALPVLPYAFVFPGVFAAVGAGLYKWIPGSFNWALVQSDPSAGMGLFHGLTAGFIWGGIIPTGLGLHQLVFWNVRTRQSVLRPVGALLFGIGAGLLSSMVVVMVILSVYGMTALGQMGWIEGLSQSQRYSMEFWKQLFFTTRMGFAHLILGTSLGLGVAMTTNSLRGSGQWNAFLQNVATPASLKGTGQLVAKIARLVLRHAWPILFALSIGGVAVKLLAHPGKFATPEKQDVLFGIIGDASAQAIGGICAVIGLGLGIVILRRGFQISPKVNAP